MYVYVIQCSTTCPTLMRFSVFPVVTDSERYCYLGPQCVLIQDALESPVTLETCCQGGGGSWGFYRGECIPCSDDVLEKIYVEHYLAVPYGNQVLLKIKNNTTGNCYILLHWSLLLLF